MPRDDEEVIEGHQTHCSPKPPPDITYLRSFGSRCVHCQITQYSTAQYSTVLRTTVAPADCPFPTQCSPRSGTLYETTTCLRSDDSCLPKLACCRNVFIVSSTTEPHLTITTEKWADGDRDHHPTTPTGRATEIGGWEVHFLLRQIHTERWVVVWCSLYV